MERTNKELINQLVKEVLYNSLAQAIIKIVQTPHVTLKLALTICVTLTSSAASYLIMKSVLSYFAYEVTTLTRTVYETQTPFPKVTICNANPYTNKYALEFLKEINREINPNVSIFDIEQLKQFSYSFKASLANEVFTLAQYRMNAESFSDANRTRLSHSISDMLISCYFSGKKCTKSDFTWEFDSRLGSCYAFNSQSRKNGTTASQSLFSGFDNGLKLTLYANFHENLSFFNSVIGNSGVKIRIENNTFLKDNSDISTDVSSGFKTDVLVERLFSFNLAKPYTNCYIDNDKSTHFDSDLYDLIKKSAYVYDQQLCFKQCRQKFYVEECNCTSARTLSLFNKPKCLTARQLECKNKVNDLFYLYQNNSILNHCYENCPLECNQSGFNTFFSSSQLVGESFVDYINENRNLSSDFVNKELNPVTARESIVKLNVFYDSLFYTISTESPKTDFVMLLAYIGGILGLFLGVSMLSICEIVELLLEIYFIANNKMIQPINDPKKIITFQHF